jgi:RNA polymerase sigma factor (sigma-70 family)
MSKKTRFHSLSDTEIWQAFKKGDLEAFEYIFNQYAHFLFNYGDRMCHQEALVEDAIQELFIEIWEKKANLGEVKSIKFYLIKSLQRKILRKLQKEPLAVNEEEMINWNHQDLIEFSYENQLIEGQINDEQQAKLQKALASLSENQRKVLFLKYYNQMSYDEIADLMALSVKAVYDLIYQALKSLRKIFEKSLFTFILTFFFTN